jgi:acetoin utilization deacetylase AcuC-like enzyme
MSKLLVYRDKLMRRHKNAETHPERPERLEAIEQRLSYASLPGFSWKTPSPAQREDILRAHTTAHVDFIDSLRGKIGMIDGDTGVSPRSIDAAYLSAGGMINAVDAIQPGGSAHAFSLGRPPGHHAERARAMGFCLFNNIAIAAHWALEVLGLTRVLIVDWDVHHGNGTQDIFYEDPRVLFVSSHQSPLYPGSGSWSEQGEGRGRGLTLNLPLPAGTGDADICYVYEQVVRPVALSWEPQLILVSAGFDAHRDDPLAGLSLTTTGFSRLTAIVQSIADDVTGGHFALSLEGGYDLHALSESVLACCRILTGSNAPSVDDPGEVGKSIVAQAARHYRWRWPMISTPG